MRAGFATATTDLEMIEALAIPGLLTHPGQMVQCHSSPDRVRRERLPWSQRLCHPLNPDFALHRLPKGRPTAGVADLRRQPVCQESWIPK